MKGITVLATALLLTAGSALSFASPVSKEEKKCIGDAYAYFLGLKYTIPTVAEVKMELMKMYILRGMNLCDALKAVMKLPSSS